MQKATAILLLCLLSSMMNAQTYTAKISTNYGNITVVLFDKTPKHRDNFVKLVKEKFYDSLLFHRVIKGFVIQGGDPTSKNASDTALLGEGDLGYTIPAEFDTAIFHKRGMLAQARDDNPQKASSACQFYIVQGKLQMIPLLLKQNAEEAVKFRNTISKFTVLLAAFHGWIWVILFMAK
jgi:cyclophilin family peptidyl-prolyl cis-trans isomerase